MATNLKSHEWIVEEYFKRIRAGDLTGILDLFSYDCVVYEPFSNSKILTGKTEIQSFLRINIMAVQDMNYEIKLDKESQKEDKKQVVAIVSFLKEHELKGKFSFHFEDLVGKSSRIKALRIEFLSK